MKEKTVKTESISSLIRKMELNDLCLPSFQRDFEWTPLQMALLLESIVRHYPIGTFMFLQYIENKDLGKNSFVKTEPNAFRPKFYVIDGQQRLRTFLYFLKPTNRFKPNEPVEYNNKKYKAFLDITTHPSSLPEDVDRPSFITAVKVSEEEIEDYEYHGKWNMIPIEYVFVKKHIKKWFKKAFKKIGQRHKQYIKNMFEIQRRISSYECPVEYLVRKLSPKDHTNIFRLLNEAGTDLTAFDFVSARLNVYHINLRELWKKCLNEYPIFEEYDIDPLYILKTLLLIRQSKNAVDKPTCAKKDLQNIHKKYNRGNYVDTQSMKAFIREFNEDWTEACKYSSKAIESMRWDFGACQKKYIPYTPMVITLAAIKWWVDIDRQYDEKFKGTIKDKLRRWYWGAVFNQSYEKATDNVVSSDYSLLREWLAIGNRRRTPSGISYKLSKQNIENAIDDIDTSGDARYKAILCLPLINGAEDIYSRECLSQTMLHDHHIYPKRAKGIKDEFSIAELNNVINRMLITDRTNQEIKNKSPYDYLVDCKGKMLKKHFLFKDIYGKRLSYNSFLKRRKKFIIKYLYNLINR